MITVALKHWIYEACINTIFDNINKNFMHHLRLVKYKGVVKGHEYRNIVVLEEYDELLRGFPTTKFHRCVIRDVYKSYFIFSYMDVESYDALGSSALPPILSANHHYKLWFHVNNYSMWEDD